MLLFKSNLNLCLLCSVFKRAQSSKSSNAQISISKGRTKINLKSQYLKFQYFKVIFSFSNFKFQPISHFKVSINFKLSNLSNFQSKQSKVISKGRTKILNYFKISNFILSKGRTNFFNLQTSLQLQRVGPKHFFQVIEFITK